MLMLGGPIPQRGIRGAIDFNANSQGKAVGGWNNAAHSPVDLRCAVSMAAGIDPFDPDMYAVSDTSAPSGTAQAVLRADIERDLLGLI